MTTLKDLKWEDGRGRPGDAERSVVTFPNGYSASVLRGGSYAYTEGGTYEVAVMWNGRIDYKNPVTGGDVLGHLSEEEVNAALAEIEALPRKDV